MFKKYSDYVYDAGTAIKRAAEVTANSVNKVTADVARNDGWLADKTEAAVQAVGAGLDEAGRNFAAVTQQAGKSLHDGASRFADAAQTAIVGDTPSNEWLITVGRVIKSVTETAAHTAGWIAGAGAVAGDATAATGRLAEKSAVGLGGLVEGVVRGTAETVSNTVDVAALPSTRIDAMRLQLRALGQVEQERSKTLLRKIEFAQFRRRKYELLDLLVVGRYYACPCCA